MTVVTMPIFQAAFLIGLVLRQTLGIFALKLFHVDSGVYDSVGRRGCTILHAPRSQIQIMSHVWAGRLVDEAVPLITYTIRSFPDEVRVDVDQLQNCGLILTVTLERNLTDPVSLNISFTDVKSFRTQTIVTDTQYSNVMVINHVVRRDKIEFCAFTLSVALENGRNNVGPFTKVPGTHRKWDRYSVVCVKIWPHEGNQT